MRAGRAARARLRLRLGHPGHRRGASSARREIDAVDIDPAAVESTLANAAGQRRRAARGPARRGRTATLRTVLANILATPLKVLAPLLCAHVRRRLRWCWPASWSARPTN